MALSTVGLSPLLGCPAVCFATGDSRFDGGDFSALPRLCPVHKPDSLLISVAPDVRLHAARLPRSRISISLKG